MSLLLGLAVSLGCGTTELVGPSTGGGPGVGSGGDGSTSQTGGTACVAPNDLPASDLLQDQELLHQDPEPELPVYVFSQSGPSAIDEQLFEVGPALSLRTTGQWGTDGTEVSDYALEAIQELQALGSRVILGLTASVVFASQWDSEAALLEVVTRDSANQPVQHDEIVPDAYRGNLAHPAFRDLIVQNAKTLIDVGADGVFFDEANSGYAGALFDGDEGFDDFHEADFRTYLCAKYPDWTPGDFMATFGLTAENALDCGAANCVGTGLSLRRYLAEAGLSVTQARATSPLMAEWGASIGNRISTDPTSFSLTSEIAYWADIVRLVRQYARETYEREILITSNGLFPFVDFQSVGLYPWNSDAPDGQVENYVRYVPTTEDGRLNAEVSLLDAFGRLRQHSRALAGEVPVVLFLDWPTEMMSDYYAFSEQEKRDYFRIYGAEAYAAGLRFAWHLKTSLSGDPTATDSGIFEWLTAEADFYRQNSALYVGAEPATVTATTPVANVALTVTTLADGALAVHLINHAYQGGLAVQDSVPVTLNARVTESTATVISPDAATQATVELGASAEVTSFEVPALTTYAVVVLR